jgi:hypothetical protein
MTPETFRCQEDPQRPRIFVDNAVAQDLPTRFCQAFGVDYFAYRAELQRIARSCLARVVGSRISVGFGDFEEWFCHPDDELIFPVDDDDLFAPVMASSLSAITDDTALVIWPAVVAGFVNFERPARVARHMLPLLFTNNWGVRKAFLQDHLDPQRARQFLAHHNLAQSESMRLLGVQDPGGPLPGFAPLVHPRVLPVLASLSVEYVHPGSLHLFSTLTNENRLAQLSEYDPTAAVPVPDHVGWAAAYLESMRTTLVRLRGA